MNMEMYINDTLHEKPPMGHIEDNVHAWGKISKRRKNTVKSMTYHYHTTTKKIPTI